MKMLRRGGVEYPVVCYAAPFAQQAEPESILGVLDAEPPVPGALDARFRGRQLFNGAIYAAVRVRVRPRLRIDARAGWYFDSLSSCEARELDLLAGRVPPPCRQPLRGEGRTAAIGIATLVAVRSAAGSELLLGRMARKAMPHRAGRLHAVPSGMFAPPYSVAANMAAELREELGLDLVDGTLFLTGVAVNLLNMRPEICTLFVVEGRRKLRLNREFLPGLVRVPLGTDEEISGALGLTAERIVPPGAAALFLGARVLRARLKA